MKTPTTGSLDTQVPARRSVQQIQALVERFGAEAFGLDYRDGEPYAVTFTVRDPSLDLPVPVRLEVPHGAVVAILTKRASTQARYRSGFRERVEEQGRRVAWRNLHDFVRASLIAVETGLLTLPEAFMANVLVTLPSGRVERIGQLANDGRLLAPAERGLRLTNGERRDGGEEGM